MAYCGGRQMPHGTACPSRCPALTLHCSQISVKWVLSAGGCTPLSGCRAGTRAAALPPGHPLLPAAGPAPRYSLTCTQQGTEHKVSHSPIGGLACKSRHGFRAGTAAATAPTAHLPCNPTRRTANSPAALQPHPTYCKTSPSSHQKSREPAESSPSPRLPSRSISCWPTSGWAAAANPDPGSS